MTGPRGGGSRRPGSPAARPGFVGLGAIVHECTNLPPHRDALGRACGVPIHDVDTPRRWLWAGAARPPAQEPAR